jgi:hypothetical protein
MGRAAETIKILNGRRFPPPWSVEDIGAVFVVKDNGGQKLGYFSHEEELGRRSAAKLLTKDEARRRNCRGCCGRTKSALTSEHYRPKGQQCKAKGQKHQNYSHDDLPTAN